MPEIARTAELRSHWPVVWFLLALSGMADDRAKNGASAYPSRPIRATR